MAEDPKQVLAGYQEDLYNYQKTFITQFAGKDFRLRCPRCKREPNMVLNRIWNARTKESKLLAEIKCPKCGKCSTAVGLVPSKMFKGIEEEWQIKDK